MILQKNISSAKVTSQSDLIIDYAKGDFVYIALSANGSFSGLATIPIGGLMYFVFYNAHATNTYEVALPNNGVNILAESIVSVPPTKRVLLSVLRTSSHYIWTESEVLSIC